MHHVVLQWCKQALVVSGGIPKVNCPEMLERSELLKTFLTDEQKQLEALDTLQELTSSMEGPQGECP